MLLLGVVVIQRAYRRHRDRHALDKLIAIKKLIQGNVQRFQQQTLNESLLPLIYVPLHCALVVWPVEATARFINRACNFHRQGLFIAGR